MSEQKRRNLVGWLLVLATSAAFGATFVSRFIWTPIMPAATEAWGLTATQAGAFVTAFFVGYIITQVPGGALADKHGSRMVLTVSLLICGAATLVLGFVDYQAGLLFRAISGLGAGTVYATGLKAIATYFDDKQRSTAMGVFFSSAFLGQMINNLMAPRVEKALGWQVNFIFAGIIVFLAAAACFFLITKEEQTQAAAKKIRLVDGLRIIMGSRDLILLCVGSFFYYWVNNAVSVWGFSFLVTGRGLDKEMAGNVFAFINFTNIIMALLWGVIIDQFKISRRNMLVLSLGAQAVMIALMGIQALPIVVCIVFIWVKESLNKAVGVSIAPLIVQKAGVEYSGTANAMQNLFNQFASVLSPMVLGYILDVSGGNYAVTWPVVSVFGLLSCFLYSRVSKDQRRPVENAAA